MIGGEHSDEMVGEWEEDRDRISARRDRRVGRTLFSDLMCLSENITALSKRHSKSRDFVLAKIVRVFSCRTWWFQPTSLS